MNRETKVLTLNSISFGRESCHVIEVQGVNLGKGTGHVELTGNLGNVAYETMKVAFNILRMRNSLILDYDYHVHFNYPGLRKEGASWGISCFIMLAWLSGYLDYKDNVTASGELDLNGKIRPVAYLEDKMAGWIQGSTKGHLFIPQNDYVAPQENIYQVANIQEVIELIDKL